MKNIPISLPLTFPLSQTKCNMNLSLEIQELVYCPRAWGCNCHHWAKEREGRPGNFMHFKDKFHCCCCGLLWDLGLRKPCIPQLPAYSAPTESSPSVPGGRLTEQLLLPPHLTFHQQPGNILPLPITASA